MATRNGLFIVLLWISIVTLGWPQKPVQSSSPRGSGETAATANRQAGPGKVTQTPGYNQLISTGYEFLKEGKPRQAYVAAAAAAQRDAGRFEAYALAALALLQQGTYPEARKFADKALSLAPDGKKPRVAEIADLIEEASATTISIDPNKLTPEVHRTLDVLQMIMNDANKAADGTTRRKFLMEFLEKSRPFAEQHPDQTSIWALRAAAALEVDDEESGREAGLNLVALGQDASANTRVRKLMATLDRKGWLAAKDDGSSTKLASTKSVKEGTKYTYNKGSFTALGQGQWQERAADGVYSFQEQGLDSAWIYLRDDSRNVSIRIPVDGGWCAVQYGPLRKEDGWTNIYSVALSQGSERQSANSGTSNGASSPGSDTLIGSQWQGQMIGTDKHHRESSISLKLDDDGSCEFVVSEHFTVIYPEKCRWKTIGTALYLKVTMKGLYCDSDEPFSLTIEGADINGTGVFECNGYSVSLRRASSANADMNPSDFFQRFFGNASGKADGLPGSTIPSHLTLSGVYVEPVTAETAAKLGINVTEAGVVVSAVDPSSPAASAGIQSGDVIQQVNQKIVRNVWGYIELASDSGNKPVVLLVRRGATGDLRYLTLSPIIGAILR